MNNYDQNYKVAKVSWTLGLTEGIAFGVVLTIAIIVIMAIYK